MVAIDADVNIVVAALPTEVVITVAGDMDYPATPQFLALFEGHPVLRRLETAVRVDLSGVGFIDSSGISALIILYKWLDDTGRALTIGPVSDRVHKVLQLSGLTELLRVADVEGD